MMRLDNCGRRAVLGAILAGGLAIAAAMPLWAETGGSSSAKKTGEAGTDESAIQKQLHQILKNQQEILTNQTAILQKFDAVMEELRIIKIRATIRGS